VKKFIAWSSHAFTTCSGGESKLTKLYGPSRPQEVGLRLKAIDDMHLTTFRDTRHEQTQASTTSATTTHLKPTQ